MAGAASARRHWPQQVLDRSTVTPGSFLNSFSYLPATFTTLFVLAASLLLGLI